MTITFLLLRYNSSSSKGEEPEMRTYFGKVDCFNNSGTK